MVVVSIRISAVSVHLEAVNDQLQFISSHLIALAELYEISKIFIRKKQLTASPRHHLIQNADAKG